MRIETLCFLLTPTRVCLGRGRRGVGEGKLNGMGGGVEAEDASAEDAAVRELEEEGGVAVRKADLEKVAVIAFFQGDVLRCLCHVFFALRWQGTPADTAEMRDFRWVSRDHIPFGEMLPADKEWLPLALAGKRFVGKARYNRDLSALQEFWWKETKFV